eukprot:9288023-Pyramimonas_sp.AAC.1
MVSVVCPLSSWRLICSNRAIWSSFGPRAPTYCTNPARNMPQRGVVKGSGPDVSRCHKESVRSVGSQGPPPP